MNRKQKVLVILGTLAAAAFPFIPFLALAAFGPGSYVSARDVAHDLGIRRWVDCVPFQVSILAVTACLATALGPWKRSGGRP